MPSADAILSRQDAFVDPDGFRVNGAGDILALIATDVAEARCSQPAGSSALLFKSHDGTRRTIGGDVGRRTWAPTGDGGFMVGGLFRGCPGYGVHSVETPPGPYMVTRTGQTVEIHWPAGAQGRRARAICTPDPADPRCVLSAGDATVVLRPDPPRTPDGQRATYTPSGVLAAAGGRGRVLWSSTDEGATWQHRLTPLAFAHGKSPAPAVINSLGYRDDLLPLGFWTRHGVDFSLDGGRTWTLRWFPEDLDEALPGGTTGPFRNVWVTQSGILLALATTPDGDGEQLIRSTDTTWKHLRAALPRAVRIPLWVMVDGDVVNATAPDTMDATRPSPWWTSVDAGEHWKREDLLPQ